MSGAVGNPFTASMFRFDGLRILSVFIYVNTVSIIFDCKCVISMNINDIYFSQAQKKPHIAAKYQEWMVR